MKVRFRPVHLWPRDAAEPAVLLEVTGEQRAGNVARVVADAGTAGLVSCGADPDVLDTPAVLYAPEVPVFDDLLAIWLLGLPEIPPAHVTDALCEYARLCRRGHTPGHVAPDRSPDAILDEIRRGFDDLGQPPQRDAFLTRLDGFFTHLRRQLEAGADVAGSELFVGTTAFRHEVDLLGRDHDLYLEDRKRGEAWVGSLSEGGAAPRELDLLVLEEPASTRFRDWARRDPDSPSGTGFALLLVRWPAGQWILSADPAKRAKVGHLAEAFEEAERARTGSDPAGGWYGGERHDGTLVAAPRTGSALEKADVLGVLKRGLHLRRAPRGRKRPWPALVGGAAAAVVVIGLLWMFVGRNGAPAPEPDPDADATVDYDGLAPGDPGLRTRGLRARKRGSSDTVRIGVYDRMYAFIVGIHEYADPALNLKNAVKDAKAVRDVLTTQYGFAEGDVVELYDAQATREAVLKQLAAFAKLGRHDALFLFWAGHGTTITTNDDEALGFLVPYDGAMQPDADVIGRDISMKQLRTYMTQVVGGKHKFLVVDTCYSGLLTTRGKGVTMPPSDAKYLRRVTQEKVFQVLTAGMKDQPVLDGGPGGHSVFAGHLIRALERAGPFLTASALSVDVSKRVQEAAEQRDHEQIPAFRLLAGEGEFVFLRSDARASEGR